MSSTEKFFEDWEVPQRSGFLLKMIKAPPFKLSRQNVVEGAMAEANAWLEFQRIKYSPSDSLSIHKFDTRTGTLDEINPEIVKTKSKAIGIIWEWKYYSPKRFEYKGIKEIVQQTLGRALFITKYDMNRIFSTHNLDWRDYYDLTTFGIEPISVITFDMEIDSYPKFIVKVIKSKKQLKNLKIYDFVLKGFHEIFQQGLNEIGEFYKTKAHREKQWHESAEKYYLSNPWFNFPWFLRNLMDDHWVKDDFSRTLVWNSPKNISESKFKIYNDRSPKFFSQLTEFYELEFDQYFSQNKLDWQKFISIEVPLQKKGKIVKNLFERDPDGINQWILYEPIPDEKLYGKSPQLPFFSQDEQVKYSFEQVENYITNKDDFDRFYTYIRDSTFLKKQRSDLGNFFSILIDVLYYTSSKFQERQEETKRGKNIGSIVASLKITLESYSDIQTHDFWKKTYKLMHEYAETVYFENEMVWILFRDTFLVHRCCWNITNYLKQNKVRLTRSTNFQSLNTKLLAICMKDSSEHKLFVSEIYRGQKTNVGW
ncbi:MAG: hypothetical protein ACW98F_11325 [Candidatus Hodarchaeales archaeon]